MEFNKFFLKEDNILYYVYRQFYKGNFHTAEPIELKYGTLVTITDHLGIAGYRIKLPTNCKFEFDKYHIRTWRGHQSKAGDIQSIVIQSGLSVFTINKDTQVIVVVNKAIDQYMSL